MRICTRCNGRPAAPGRRTCPHCLAKGRDHAARRRGGAGVAPAACPCCDRRVRVVIAADRRCARCRNGSCASCRTPGHRDPARLAAERAAADDPRLAALAERAAAGLPLFDRRDDRPNLPLLLNRASDR